MNAIRIAKEDKVPFFQKIAFGSGHLANQLFPAALGVFMVVLVMSLGMNPILAGLLGALPRLIDALTDLLWDLYRITPNPDGDGGNLIFCWEVSLPVLHL